LQRATSVISIFWRSHFAIPADDSPGCFQIMRLIVQKYPSSHPESSAAEEPAELEFDPYSPLESHTPSAPAIKMTLCVVGMSLSLSCALFDETLWLSSGLRQGVIQGKDGKVKPKDDGVDDNHGAEMWSLMSASTDDLYA
jgi:hypothetical protein